MRSRPGEADLALLRRATAALGHRADPGRVVRQRQFAVAGRRRLGHAHAGQRGLGGLAQQPVLGHREAVARRQRQHEVRRSGRRSIGADSRNSPLDCCSAAKSACNAAREPYTSFHVAAQQRCSGSAARFPRLTLTWRYTMTFTPEQLMAAHKANVETLFGLTTKAFEGVEKLVELNLQVATRLAGRSRRNDPGRDVGQGRAGTDGPASQPAAAGRREGRLLQPPPVRHHGRHQRRSGQGRPKPRWPTARRRSWPWSTTP